VVPEYTKLEAETREIIDKKLELAGWAIQDKKRINLYEKLDVAAREVIDGRNLAKMNRGASICTS